MKLAGTRNICFFYLALSYFFNNSSRIKVSARWKTFPELYIDKVIRWDHQFIDQNVYEWLGNIWNQSLDFIVKIIP